MSTWKKAAKVNQKTHRERHQPLSRSHLGLLEKKADYKERALDQNRKKRILRILKKRSLNKNPDEFYFKMVNSKLINDEHREMRKSKEHTSEQIKLMQTTDLRYINFKRVMESKTLDKLRSNLHFVDKTNSVKNKHVFFVDNEEEMESFDLARHLDTDPSLLSRKNRPRISELKNMNIPNVDDETSKKIKQQENKSYNELEKRAKREQQLSIIQRKLELKRHLQNNEAPPKRIKKATPSSAPVYKWPAQRKR